MFKVSVVLAGPKKKVVLVEECTEDCFDLVIVYTRNEGKLKKQLSECTTNGRIISLIPPPPKKQSKTKTKQNKQQQQKTPQLQTHSSKMAG